MATSSALTPTYSCAGGGGSGPSWESCDSEKDSKASLASPMPRPMAATASDHVGAWTSGSESCDAARR